jgi:hypothetical protein
VRSAELSPWQVDISVAVQWVCSGSMGEIHASGVQPIPAFARSCRRGVLVEGFQFVHTLSPVALSRVAAPVRMVDSDARECASAPADIQARQPASRWLLLAPATSTSALGALGFAYAAVMLSPLGIDGKERDLALFIIGALLLAPACAAAQVFLVRPDFQSPRPKLVESVNCWAAITLLLALASIPIVMYVAAEAGESWIQNAKRVVLAVATLYIAGLVVAMLRARSIGNRHRTCSARGRRRWPFWCSHFFAAVVALFWVDPSSVI